MRDERKMKAGHGMTGPLVLRCGIQIFRRERDLLILTDGMRDSFKWTAGCRIKKGKSHVYLRYANCDSNRARAR